MPVLTRAAAQRLVATGTCVTILSSCASATTANPATTATRDTADVEVRITEPATSEPATTQPTPISTTATSTNPASTPPSSAPTTTAAPATTIGATPEEIAKAEVLQTLDAFWTDVDACNAAPSECETTRVIDTYIVPTTTIATWLVDRIDRLVASNERSTELERNERRIANFQFDGSSRVATTQCMTDRSVRVRDVEGSTEVVDDGVGFFRIDFILERTDDRWIITDSIISRVEQSGSGICAT